MRRKPAVLLMLGAVAWAWAALPAAETPGAATDTVAVEDRAPFARVGRASAQPEYHGGAFKAFGWGQSSAFCGMRDANLPGAPFVGQDASWWLTYDEDALYVACMIVLAAEGEHFVASATADGDPAIFGGDHLLVQVAPDPNVGSAGVPFLRVVVNPSGATWASTMEAEPGQDYPVDTSRIAYGNHVGRGHIPGHWWLARLRIPLDLLGVTSLDGVTAKVHLAWSTEPLYLSWGGVKQDEWAGAPEVCFDPQPRTSLRLNGSYPRLFSTSGGLHLDLQSSIFAGDQADPVAFRFGVSNLVQDAVTWEKTWQDRRTSGQRCKFTAREHVENRPDEVNRLDLTVTTALAGHAQLLYRDGLPYQPRSPAVDAALTRWREVHAFEPKAAASFDYVYYPYTEQVDALVSAKLNVGVYAGDEQARAERIAYADRLRAEVFDSAGKRLADAEGPVSDGDGHAVLQLPQPVADGTYRLALELFEGDQVADRREMDIVRQHFAWEQNGIGSEKVIIPPWTEVGTNSGQAVTCWGRTYVLQNSGLPAAVVSQGTDVLGGPIRLSGIVAGEKVQAAGAAAPRIALVPGEAFPAGFERYELASNQCPVAGEDFALQPVNGYAADVAATSRLGAVEVGVKARLDYDGLYTVSLHLSAKDAVTVDSLTMTIPIAPEADLYRLQRITAMEALGAIPQGEGVLAKSSDLSPHPALTGNFVPVVFAGDYDHGLFWLAESDRGWSVDDADEQVLLVREQGELALQFRLIARPTVLDRPRTIEFALMATPTRPKAVGYRQAFWEGKRTHDTAGFRFYGDGVNGFQLYEPEEYEGLRKFLSESGGIRPHYRDAEDTPPGHRSYYKVRNEMAKQGYPVTLYGCTWGANAGMRSFPTYGSTWTHTARTLETGRQHVEFRNWTNFGGTSKWQTPAQLTPVYTLMDESFVDAWLWHMSRIARFSGVNGCFFDCFESLPRGLRGRVKTDITGVAYRREDGQLRPFANPLRYHQRTRRFATALWLMGRPPALLQSNNFDNNYGPTWYVEGPMYHDEVGETLIEQGVTPDKAAAYTASCSGMGFCRSDVRVAERGRLSPQEEAVFRVLLAYGILHDLPWGGTPSWLSKNVQLVMGALRDALGIADPEVRHIRYWHSGEGVTVSTDRVLAGGFVHPNRKKALLAVLNPSRESLRVRVALDASLFGSDAVDVREVSPVEPAGVDTLPAPFSLGPYSVRFLAVETSDDHPDQ